MIIVLVIIGLFIGAGLSGIEGSIIGGIIGLFSGFYFKLRDRFEQLDHKHNHLQASFDRLSEHYQKHQFEINKTQNLETLAQAAEDSLSEEVQVESKPSKINITRSKTVQPEPPQVTYFDNEMNTADSVSSKTAKQLPGDDTKEEFNSEAADNNRPQQPSQLTTFIKKFLFEGNPIVKIASVVLFFGVAFLLKYAAEQNFFPIEWRFIGVALVAVGLLVWGLKLRRKHRQYGLVIQGLSIGILYLTTYSASALYPLLPLNLAFFCLLLLSLVSAILAVKQDAPSLAIIAVIGGFLAPILTSSGSNAYVKLFSYYAVLNIGILVISLFKSWRFLCWLGFAFTFVIGSFWGYQSYRPEYFSTTEPFLVFHFLLYLLIPVLFLRLKHMPAKPIIQTSVIFGLPTISFLLQLYLVQDFEHGKTYSALAWASAYFIAGLAIHLLRNKAQPESKNLLVSYLAIGVTFFSIFIFYLFDQDITSVLWALEAVGLTWLGLRQKELFPKLAGWVLIILASWLYLDNYNYYIEAALFANSQFISGLLIALSALAMGFFYANSNKKVSPGSPLESLSPLVLLIPASIFIAGLGYQELFKLEVTNFLLPGFLIYLSLFAISYFVIGRLLKWQQLAQTALALIPALLIISLAHFFNDQSQNPLAFLGYLAYPVTIYSSHLILQKSLKENFVPISFYQPLLIALLLVTTFISSWIAAYLCKGFSQNGHWFSLIFGIVPTIALLLLINKAKSLDDESPHKNPLVLSQYILSAYLVLWLLITTFSNLHPENIPFLSLLNPLDLSHGFLLYALYKLLQTEQSKLQTKTLFDSHLNYLIYFVGFVFINMVLARSFHHYSGVVFEIDALFSAPMFQLTLTIAWSLLAAIVMYFARARQSRPLWITGATLLVAILIKLVLFDMADSGTLARIISFLIVGCIMLGIGYFVPMPPNQSENKQS